MVSIPRFKNIGDRVSVRNDADTSDIGLKALDIALTGGSPAAGKILTSDGVGLGSWQVNPAIQAAADANTAAGAAQTTADAANTAAGAAQTTANSGVSAAAAAQTTANGAISAAAAADAAAAAAAAAAAGAGTAAAAAGVAAAAAAATATAAAAAAAAAGVAAAAAAAAAVAAHARADAAYTLAEKAHPSTMQLFADELIWSVGAPTISLGSAFGYNMAVFTTTNLAVAFLDVNLRAGTWTFKFMVMKRNDAPKVSINVGLAILADPLELYAAAANNIFIATYTGVSIGSSDIHRVGFYVNGHTSPSTGYVFLPVKFWGYRTGV